MEIDFLVGLVVAAQQVTARWRGGRRVVGRGAHGRVPAVRHVGLPLLIHPPEDRKADALRRVGLTADVFERLERGMQPCGLLRPADDDLQRL